VHVAMAQIRLALNESAYFEFDDVESPLQVYSRADIERVHAAGITLYHPLPGTKKGKPDPALPRDDDGLGIAVWRQRTSTPSTSCSSSVSP